MDGVLVCVWDGITDGLSLAFTDNDILGVDDDSALGTLLDIEEGNLLDGDDVHWPQLALQVSVSPGILQFASDSGLLILSHVYQL